MADGKNVQLSDELLIGAIGGFITPEQQLSSFDAIGGGCHASGCTTISGSL
jgi:hypothetical protein